MNVYRSRNKKVINAQQEAVMIFKICSNLHTRNKNDLSKESDPSRRLACMTANRYRISNTENKQNFKKDAATNGENSSAIVPTSTKQMAT